MDFSLVEVGKPLKIRNPDEIHRNGGNYAFLEGGKVSVYGDNLRFIFDQDLDAETIFFHGDFLFSKSRQGFDIYKRKKKHFENIFRRGEPFKFLKNVKFGLFGGQPGFVGYDGEWKLFSISVEDIGVNFPVWPVNVQLKGLLTIDRIFNRTQDNIIIENNNQISIYSLESSNLVLLGELQSEFDKFSSGYFKNDQIKDIVLFKNKEFLLFSFDEKRKTFKQIYKEKISEHPIIFDLDKDGVDEMIYNSRYGQHVKVYNKYKNKFYTKKVYGGLIQYLGEGRTFGLMEKGLQAYKIEKKTNILEEKQEIKKDFKSIRPEIKYERTPKEKLLKNSLEILSFYQIDKNSGQARLRIPGISQNLEFFLNYDGGSDKEGLLGKGWSIEENKIALVYGPSIYQEVKYYLVLKNVFMEMKKNEKGYSVEGYEVKFDDGWKVQIDETTWTFDNVIYKTKWRNWYGSGDDINNRMFLPSEYLLSKIEYKNHTVIYEYDNGRVKSMFSHNERIDFFYDKTILIKYAIEGVGYKEEINFNYVGNQLLSSLSQKGQVFIKFEYENGRMVKIKTEDVSIEYEYELSPEYDKLVTFHKNVLTYDLKELLAISYNEGNKTFLKIYNGKMEQIENCEINESPNEIFNIKDLLYLVFDRRIEILKKNETVSFKFDTNTTFIPASDIVVFQGKKVGVIDDFQVTELFPATPFSIFDHTLAFYDGKNINLAFKKDKWIIKKIKYLPGFWEDIEETVRLFDFSKDYASQINNLFKKNSLQIYSNMIVMSKWIFENPHFKTVLKIIILDENHEIYKEESITIVQDSVEDFVKDTVFDGTLFKIVYNYENGRLSHKVVDFEGEPKELLNKGRKELEEQVKISRENIINQINSIRAKEYNTIDQEASVYYNKENSRKDLVDIKVQEERLKVDTHLKSLENLKFQELESMRLTELQKIENQEKEIRHNVTKVIPKDYFMLDRGRYYFHLNDNEITFGDIKIVYSGNSFRIQKVEDYKKNLILDDKCSFKLEETYHISCRNFNFDLQEKDLGRILNGYPFFIATSDVLVLFYKNLEPKIEKINSSLLRNKNFLMMENTELEVRPQFLRYSMPEYLIKEVRLKYENRKMITGYEYDKPSLQYGRLVFDDVTVIPGNNKKKFGYIKNDSVYDGNNRFIKKLHIPTTSESPKKNLKYDKTGLLVIYEKELSDDEMFYYGFEDYENNERFEYDGQLLKGFSFTGINYLKAKIIRGVFKPKYVNVYTVSAWIRTEKVNIGDKIINLQINYGLYGVLGEVLLERNGWYYVKGVFDMAEAQSVNEMMGRTESALEIKIVDCDIDHIKYSPEINSMEVNVYNEEGQITEIIDSSGLVKKYLYRNSRKSAEVDEFGNVSIFQHEGDRTNLEISGKGRFEEFSISSFGKSVAIDDSSWSVSPAKITHFNKDVSVLKIYAASQDFALSFSFGLDSESEIALGEIKIHQKNIKADRSYDIRSNDIQLVKIKNKIFLFSGGEVLLEKNLNVNLDIKFKGFGFIENLFIFENPTVRLRHYDAIKNKIQDIKLRDEYTAIVIEYLYDEIGRNDIVTSPYVVRTESLFRYHEEFVRNRNPEDESSVWKSGKILGVPNEDGFMRIEYKNDPLNRKEVVQLPGNLTKRFIYRKNAILNILFPSDFYFVTEIKGNLETTKVYDLSDNWRGTYIKDKHGKGSLSTYEYEGKLVTQILPPLYHENAGTLRRLRHGDATEKEKALKKMIGVNMKYEKGRLVERTSPDAGRTRYVYQEDKLKFIIYPDSVTYFQYESGRLRNVGFMNSMSANSTVLYQTLNYGLKEKNPLLKDNVFRKITYDQTTIVEEMMETKDILKKRIIFPPSLTIEMSKKLDGNRLSMEYPVLINGKKLKVDYVYDRTGQISSINGDGINVSFTYDDMNRLSSENFNGRFRSYRFSPAGFLKEMSDDLMKEEISYDASFTGLKFDEGIVHKTKFESRWMEKTEEDECFAFFNENNYTQGESQTKVFYSELDLTVPEKCPSVLRNRFPVSYGHVYDYGKNDELVKAKFYIDSFEPPLSLETFKSHNFTEEAWKDLVKFGFVIEDKELSTSTWGRKGKSIVNEKVFKMSNHQRKAVEKAILAYIAGKEIKPETESFQVLQEIAGLEDLLHEKFIRIFKNQDIKKCVGLLRESFGSELGKAEFDVDYYAFDPNGNHRRFYNGIDRYELVYIQDTNKVDYMLNRRRKYAFGHDARGNVIKAEHKKIKMMKYNPVTNLVNEIEMDDSTKIFFSYDSDGERVKKSVYKDGSLITNVFYFRDEDGKVLLERRENSDGVTLTTYVYGNRGLIAFYRKDELYQVVTDHEGSIRLIVKDERVVAAFDYLPYGNLMREAIFDEDGLIFYRFTGQEYDPETGLYNYHARLYDPTTGRFYQIDPQWQSFSPYKYAGNSPVTMVDPDGEFFVYVLVLTVVGVTGAYLAGAAANNKWNPRDWDWKSKRTWTAIGKGFVNGITISISFMGGVGVIKALGVSTKIAAAIVTSMTTSKALEKINTNANWDFSSPSTYWELFQIVSVSSKETKEVIDNLNFKDKLHPKGFLKKEAKRLAKNVIKIAKEVTGEEDLLKIVEKFLNSDDSEKKSMLKSFRKKAPFILLHNLLSNAEHVDKSAGQNYIKALIKRSKDASVTYDELRSKIEEFKNSYEYAYIKKAIKSLMDKREKRDANDILLTSYDNVTFIGGLSDNLFYINQGSHDLRKPLEEGLDYLRRLYKEKNIALVSELTEMLKDKIQKSKNDFNTEEDGFVIIDDRFKLVTKLTLDILSLVGDSPIIKENMNEFIRKLLEENNFQKVLNEIQNPSEFLQDEREERNTDSLVLSTYCEPFVHERITDKTWMEELEGSGPDLDPVFPSDLNGTLLLANVLLAKHQKKNKKVRKAKISKRENAMLTTYAIIDAFEKQYPSISLDFYELQNPMQNSIFNMRTEEISPLIKSHIDLSDRSLYEKTESIFESKLNKIFFENCKRLAGYEQTDPHLTTLAQQTRRCEEPKGIYSDEATIEKIHCKNSSICATARSIYKP